MPWVNYTPRAQQVFAFSRKEAEVLRHDFVGTEHLLLGLLHLGGGVAVAVLQGRGADLDAVRKSVVELVGYGPEEVNVEKPGRKRWVWFGRRKKEAGAIPFVPRVKRVLACAAREAKAMNHSYVGTEHLLLGLIAEGEGVAAKVLVRLGIDVESLRADILEQLAPNAFPPIREASEASSPLIREAKAIRLDGENHKAIVVGLDRARAIAAARVVTGVGEKFGQVLRARREILAELAPCHPAEIVFYLIPLDEGSE